MLREVSIPRAFFDVNNSRRFIRSPRRRGFTPLTDREMRGTLQSREGPARRDWPQLGPLIRRDGFWPCADALGCRGAEPSASSQGEKRAASRDQPGQPSTYDRELTDNELRDEELEQVAGGSFDIGNIVSGVVKATTVVVASEPPKIGFLGW
jgi:hypothetical protein